MDDGLEPIAGDELLYRRVPAAAGWYDPATGVLKPEAFGPHKTNDTTGLSISRAKYATLEQAGMGRPGKTNYVAVLPAADVLTAGISVEPRPNTPDGYDPAHAELPDLNSANRKESKTLERQRVLVTLCLRIEGPYTTPQE